MGAVCVPRNPEWTNREDDSIRIGGDSPGSCRTGTCREDPARSATDPVHKVNSWIGNNRTSHLLTTALSLECK